MLDSINSPPPSYYKHIRADIVNLVSHGAHRVLDVGCGSGALGEFLKQQGLASEVIGVELSAEVAKEASGKLDRVFCADLNKVSVGELLTKHDVGQFDYIVLADVLEHLIDPWESLSALTSYLAVNGKIIVSLPNVRHWSVWGPLVFRGKWEYREKGIMDRTHLRFFTKCSAMSLLENSGLKIRTCRPLLGGGVSRQINTLTMSVFSGILSRQFVLVGEKIENTSRHNYEQ